MESLTSQTSSSVEMPTRLPTQSYTLSTTVNHRVSDRARLDNLLSYDLSNNTHPPKLTASKRSATESLSISESNLRTVLGATDKFNFELMANKSQRTIWSMLTCLQRRQDSRSRVVLCSRQGTSRQWRTDSRWNLPSSSLGSGRADTTR